MFKTLLLAVDINDPGGSSRCVTAAKTMATSFGADLHVVNVVPDSGMAIVAASLGADHSEQAVSAATQALMEWSETAFPDLKAGNRHVTQGTVYDQILKVAGKIGADAIVVGAHRPELKDYLIGPNAARIARHAAQSVFVVR